MAAPALKDEKDEGTFVGGLKKDNPFAKTDSIPSTGSTVAAPAPITAAPKAVPFVRQYPQVAAQNPAQDEEARTAGLKPFEVSDSKGNTRAGFTGVVTSQADFYNRPGAKPGEVGAQKNPFANGFFKTDAQRKAIETERLGPVAAFPRQAAAPVTAPAVTPPVPTDPAAAAKAGMSRVTPYQVPGTPMTTSIDPSAGTRRPFIAGADGKNVAKDFVAGGNLSSQKAGADPTLDTNYVAGLPRTPVATKPPAATPAVGATRAVAPVRTVARPSSIPTSGPNLESPSAHTVPDYEEPQRPLGLPRTRNQRAAPATRPRLFGG